MCRYRISCRNFLFSSKCKNKTTAKHRDGEIVLRPSRWTVQSAHSHFIIFCLSVWRHQWSVSLFHDRFDTENAEDERWTTVTMIDLTQIRLSNDKHVLLLRIVNFRQEKWQYFSSDKIFNLKSMKRCEQFEFDLIGPALNWILSRINETLARCGIR